MKQVPDHPNRSRILGYLQTNPGASVQDLADHLGLHRNAIVHHVRTLAGARQVVTMRQGRRILHFPATELDKQRRSRVGMLRLGTVRSLLAAMAQDPTIPWRRLAREVGITPHTVRWHVQRMEKEGLIETTWQLGGHIVSLHPDAHAILAQDGALGPMPHLPQPEAIGSLPAGRPSTA